MGKEKDKKDKKDKKGKDKKDKRKDDKPKDKKGEKRAPSKGKEHKLSKQARTGGAADTAKLRASKPNMGAVAGRLYDEYVAWLDSGVETALMAWVKVNEDDFQVLLRFGDHDDFSVTYPEDYPNTDDAFFVFADKMDAWSDAMQDVCDKKMSFTELLSHAVAMYLKHGPESDDEGGGYVLEGDTEDWEDVDDFAYHDEVDAGKGHKEFDAVEEEFATKKFLEIGSPAASLRLLKDLKNIRREGDQKLGFSASPVVERGQSLENLYHWEVRLFGFDGDLGRDLKGLAAPKQHVELEMRFSKDYPFTPPFVRVVRPRFKFLTGHVTVGGSICMELLTNSGWRSTNDIESILIQIRAEMQGGGARIDGDSEYNEREAWDAFYRAASNHGWDVKGLSAHMFPSI